MNAPINLSHAVVAALRGATVDVWEARRAYGVGILAYLILMTFRGTAV